MWRAAACVTDRITDAFEQLLETVVHSMEAVHDGHPFRLTYFRKHWDMHMLNGYTFAFAVRFGGSHRRGDRDRDGGGGHCDNFKTARSAREG
eukprot:jgi/Tetstr1/449301/TSEL_003816.t1